MMDFMRRCVLAAAVLAVCGVGRACQGGFVNESATSAGFQAGNSQGPVPYSFSLTDGDLTGSYILTAKGIVITTPDIKFSLAAIPAGATITSATFSVALKAPVFFEFVSLVGFGSNTTQAVAGDFFANPAPPGDVPNGFGLGTFQFGETSPTILQVDATKLIGQLVSSGTPAVGLALQVLPPNGTSSASATFFGLNASNPADLPTLSITYQVVPEPSSLALCGVAGVVGLAVARWRRKRN